MSSKEEVAQKIIEKGNSIRELKTAKASKEAIDAAVAELLSLKESYKALNDGVPYDPPKVEVPPKAPKAASAPQPVVEKDGPSKKELNKLARKERQKNYKAGESDGDAQNSTPTPTPNQSESKTSAPAPVAPVVDKAPTSTDNKTSNISGGVYFNPKVHSPDLSRLVSAVLQVNLGFFVSSTPNDDKKNISDAHLPYLSPPTSTFQSQHIGSSSISGDANISRYLSRSNNTKQDLYHSNNVWLASEVDQWLDIYTSLLSTDTSTITTKLVPLVNQHMSDNTYAVGNTLSLADLAIYVLLTKITFKPSSEQPHVSRYLSMLQATLPQPTPIGILNKPTKNTSKTNSANDTTSSASAAVNNSTGAGADEEGGTCPPLEDATEGQVCTRFPPEPSGYLHIGHAKAVLLNQYYAQRYKGKLIVRFDDTNPSKEKEEYAENILQDLQTLGVKPDKVTHTSDHFAKCEELARKMISEGKAYMDDTDQETMQAERLKMQESVRRNTTPEENLKVFNDMLKGETYAQKYCLRAKIDMNSVNGTLRDPVLYRYNDTPHHRTGSKYKGYPTYDFACPIVDSVEGVSHALRTTEYNDRDEQYHWLQNALQLRPVKIQAFGKMNFVNTVLSKRKLNWFVDQGLVEGWFDPRFPTIQGCVRRGVNVEALKNFILSQGASRRVITMEWDKFWSENKKVLEESSARYMGVNTIDTVEFHITNVSTEIQAVNVQIHPQKPELGLRVMRKYNKLLIDQADAVTFKEGEEVTFLRWGNFFIDKIIKDTLTGEKVLSMEGRFHPEATNFSKTKKTTWLAAVKDNIPCKLVEFDHLISKAKLGDDEDFKDFVNPHTRKESSAICDACLRLVPAGEVIQLERKGFFRVDQMYGGPDKPAVLFAIPDGRVVKQPATNTCTPAAPSNNKDGKKKK